MLSKKHSCKLQTDLQFAETSAVKTASPGATQQTAELGFEPRAKNAKRQRKKKWWLSVDDMNLKR
jgi:Tfp pilus assembly protein FimT